MSARWATVTMLLGFAAGVCGASLVIADIAAGQAVVIIFAGGALFGQGHTILVAKARK